MLMFPNSLQKVPSSFRCDRININDIKSYDLLSVHQFQVSSLPLQRRDWESVFDDMMPRLEIGGCIFITVPRVCYNVGSDSRRAWSIVSKQLETIRDEYVQSLEDLGFYVTFDLVKRVSAGDFIETFLGFPWLRTLAVDQEALQASLHHVKIHK